MAAALYVCFSHGKESGPWGTKIAAMADLARDRGLAVESIDYQGMEEPVARVDKLVAHCAPLRRPLVLVGSSMGGHVAAAASARLPDVRGLFLIAPAFFMPGYEGLTPVPKAGRIAIVHGWRDEVVPPANSIRFAAQYRSTLHMIDGDHRLTDHLFEINRVFDWFLDDVGAAFVGGASVGGASVGGASAPIVGGASAPVVGGASAPIVGGASAPIVGGASAPIVGPEGPPTG